MGEERVDSFGIDAKDGIRHAAPRHGPPPSVTRLSTQPRDATPPAARPTPGNSRKAEPHSIQSQLHAPLLYDCLPNRLSVPNSAILPISLLPLSNGMKGASVMGLSPPVGPHPVALS